MKKANDFQIAKFSLRVLLSFCLILCQFQPCVAYKSAAYKKKHVVAVAERYLIIIDIYLRRQSMPHFLKIIH